VTMKSHIFHTMIETKQTIEKERLENEDTAGRFNLSTHDPYTS